MNDMGLRQLFGLCKEKNKFVFEVSNMFGDKLTVEEMEYWFIYNVITSANIYDVNISNMGFEEALKEIEISERKRRHKWKSKGASSRRKIG